VRVLLDGQEESHIEVNQEIAKATGTGGTIPGVGSAFSSVKAEAAVHY
jgi:hypothetical protein